MEEQKLIKKGLFKNTLINFAIFLIMFLIFDLIVYNQVSNSLYTSIDEELNSSKEQYEMFGAINIGGAAETDLNRRGVINRKDDDENIDIDEEIAEEFENAVVVLPEDNIPEDLELPDIENNDSEQNLTLEERNDYFESRSPRVITIVRDLNGEITSSQSVGDVYEDFESDISFDSTLIDTIYTLEVNSEYYYRAVNFISTDENGEEVYVQLLANVDGEIETLRTLITVLVSGTIILTLIAIFISYILAKRVVRPIIESYRKQTEFVQNASHELRTPLTIIQAQQELLLQEPNSKIIDQSENINQTLKETKRMAKLIKELMNLARSDSGKQKLEKTEFNINDLIKEIIVPYKEYAKSQKKEIKLNLNEVKPITADKNKISELLIIVLDNSIKYTNPKDTITITTEKKDGKLSIEIADTGIGISDEIMPHIFERFYRGDESHSKKIEGSGLGLSIAQSIVDMHKGTIKAMHNVPKGTKFLIKL